MYNFSAGNLLDRRLSRGRGTQAFTTLQHHYRRWDICFPRDHNDVTARSEIILLFVHFSSTLI